MKTILLTITLALSVSIAGFSQCGFAGLNPVYCEKDAAVNLTETTAGGNFSGPGISGSTFDPETAGTGSHTIEYRNTNVYAVDQTGTFAPIDISGGTVITFTSQEAYSAQLPIGFSFEFFGNTYTDFYICTNGFITFTSSLDFGCCSGPLLPKSDDVSNVIALCWDDLVLNVGGTVRYATTGIAPNRVLSVEFNSVEDWFGDEVFSQLQIYESTNIIEIHSLDVDLPSSVGAYTQGIENLGGTIAYTAPGRNKAMWSATNDFVAFIPCSTSQGVTVNASPAVFAGVAQTTCDGDAITLTGTGTADTYTWDNSVVDGVPFTQAIGTIKYTVIGEITASGCQVIDSVEVSVGPVPVVSAGLPQTVCEGDTVTLTATGDADTYTWDGGIFDGVPFVTTASDPLTYTVTGEFTATGCTSTDMVDVTVNPLPIKNLGNDTILCHGLNGFTLDAGTPGSTYSWSTGDGNVQIITPTVVVSSIVFINSFFIRA